MRLDQKPDWKEVEALLRRSYKLTAPKMLAAMVNE
jgi:predicted DNA-binding protein (MmcQ/YjbR family)